MGLFSKTNPNVLLLHLEQAANKDFHSILFPIITSTFLTIPAESDLESFTKLKLIEEASTLSRNMSEASL